MGITLQFKVYIPDILDNSDSDTCEGDVQIKLKRPEIQRKEDPNMEEKIKQKVIRRYNVSDVFIDSQGYIYGCKPPPTTTTNPVTTPTPTQPSITKTTTNTTSNARDLHKILLVSICCIALIIFLRFLRFLRLSAHRRLKGDEIENIA